MYRTIASSLNIDSLELAPEMAMDDDDDDEEEEKSSNEKKDEDRDEL